ncbi:MAG: hypothetical protein GW938_10555 [Leptospira sp.]|nr:hypothetical protein [Leptospira sp.]NCS93029.1 hypothetical protein [Leptospira sp.]
MSKFISSIHRITYSLILITLFVNCLFDEPGTISGKEANQIITSKALAKIQSCGVLAAPSKEEEGSDPDPLRRPAAPETSNSFFLMATLFLNFEAFNMFDRYKKKDINECADDLDFLDCNVIASAWKGSINAGAAVGGIICKDVKKK